MRRLVIPVIVLVSVWGCSGKDAELQSSGDPSPAPVPVPGMLVSEAAAAESPDGLVWVAKSDEARSCEKDSGIELYAMEKDLKAAGIQIVDKRKVHDKKIRIQMCGIDKGDLNAFKIQNRDFEKAKALGFSALSELVKSP